ncbi:MAG: NADP-dependent oxidoreductase [Ginsengibacter sp.]
MKAAILKEFGKAENIEIVDVPNPEINDEQVLIRVMAVGINPVDTKVRAGTSGMSKRIKLPAILGWDVSGIIVKAGKNVSDFKEGEAVFGCIGFPGLGSAYAEYTLADPKVLAKKPDNISFEEAAAVSLVGLTAWQAIHEQIHLTSGQSILIQAAAGGVGHLAVQFAKINGGYVSGTASEKNKAFLKSLGVDQFIDYKKEKFDEIVHNADAAIDAIGGNVLYRTIKCVKRGGVVVCLPSSTKDDPKAIEIAKELGIQLIWPMMHTDGTQLRIIADLLKQEKIQVFVDKIFTLNQIARAHKAIETHGTKGKIVVKIG